MASEPDNLEEDFDTIDDVRADERRALARCPHCGSPNIRRSHTAGIWDRVLRLAGQRAYRCRDCRDRFHGPRRRMEV